MNNVKDLQTIEETLKYLQFDNWEQSAPGLARSRELLGLLGNPEQKLKFVHIAGTNGKGSTAAMLASVLQRAGYRTVFVSEMRELSSISSPFTRMRSWKRSRCGEV